MGADRNTTLLIKMVRDVLALGLVAVPWD